MLFNNIHDVEMERVGWLGIFFKKNLFRACFRNGALINCVFMRGYFFHIQGKKRRRPHGRRGFLTQ